MSTSENRSNRSDNGEIIGIVLFFCAIIVALFYYLPSDITGLLGSFFKSTGFGLLGISAHAIPVFLVYAAIDSFVEKRKKVKRMRIGTVIVLLICVSAIIASFSMDFEYFKSLTLVGEDKYSAFKAISLLWKSGLDGSLITPIDKTIHVVPGGLLGGLIATAIETVCGKIVTCIFLIGFTLALIISIFRISVKQTAKVVKQAATETMQQVKNQQRRRPVSNQPSVPVQRVPVTREVPIINVPVQPANTNIPVETPWDDPFSGKQMPVDRETGFIDVNGTAESPFVSSSTTLNYGNTAVPISENQNTADFSFTANPQYHGLEVAKPIQRTSLEQPVETGKLSDFYDLSDDQSSTTGVQNVNSASTGYEPDELDTVDDVDSPYEIEGEILDVEGKPAPGVRTPHVPVNVFDYGANRFGYTGNQETISPAPTTNVAPVISPEPELPVTPVAPVVPVVSEVLPVEPLKPVVAPKTVVTAPIVDEPELNHDVRINTASSTDGVSNVESRTIDTNTDSKSEQIAADINTPKRIRAKIVPAPTSLISGDPKGKNANNDAELRARAAKLETALASFGIEAKVVDITYGPAITRFELTLKTGIKVSKVNSLVDDIQLAMAATSVRIEAPIPGKSAIGIEIPNDKINAVHLRNLLETEEFRKSTPLTVALGRDIPGKPILCDLAKMPHLLVAGSTGSGKSVCVNSILLSILCKETPDKVRLILIDPKQVELSIYNGIPHLITPVVVDPKKATNALKWAVQEMTRRYALLAENKVRNIEGCNAKLIEKGEDPLPLILLVIDEFADIMAVAAKDVEEQVMRLAAMSRAAGIHMILATQRPSVDVITGVLKNNMPSRIAFAVTSGVDSRTILDSVGAEKLLGKGDMLYAPQSAPKPIRGQGAFVPDDEVEKVIEFLKRFGTNYDNEVNNFINAVSTESSSGGSFSSGSDSSSDGGSAEDELLDRAVSVVIEAKAASISILQRRLAIGYPRAGKLIDLMEQKHIIGPFEGSKPRKVLITETDWLEMKARGE